jgi:anti-anti-sigma factor
VDQTGGIEIVDADRSVVRLWGDVDALLRDQASAALVRLLERGGPYVIDVGDVTFIDSSGLAFILQLHRVAGDENTHVVLRDPPTLVLDMLDLIGVKIPLEFSTASRRR